jgi:hypothetical protein
MRSTFAAIAATMVVAATNPTFAAARHHHSTPTFAAARHHHSTPTFAAARHHHSTPTFASARQSQLMASQNQPSYDSCGALSVERGAAPGQGNSSNPDALYKAFMRQCLAGQIPLGR